MSSKRLIPYGIAVLAVAVAVCIALLGGPGTGGLASPFLAAVMLSAWYGGLGPGLLATGLSALTLDFLLPSLNQPGAGPAIALRVAIFVLVALLISTLNAHQRQLEKALRRKDQQKDELLAVLAHELRNPLTAIVTALRAMREERRHQQHETTLEDIAERQTRNLSRLVDDLVDVSRIGLGKMHLSRTTVDLSSLAAAAVEAVRSQLAARGHHLDVSLPETSVLVDGDPTRLEQVIVNLLTNAIRYTEPGGCIGLTVQCQAGQAVLRVRDTGVGLAPEVLPHIFDLFTQAENGARGGLGIGLNLVRSLVRLHGGEVTASSEGPGHGSEFVVTLPIAVVAPRAAGLVPAG